MSSYSGTATDCPQAIKPAYLLMQQSGEPPLDGMLETGEMPSLTAVCASAACLGLATLFGPLDGFLDGFGSSGAVLHTRPHQNCIPIHTCFIAPA